MMKRNAHKDEIRAAMRTRRNGIEYELVRIKALETLVKGPHDILLTSVESFSMMA